MIRSQLIGHHSSKINITPQKYPYTLIIIIYIPVGCLKGNKCRTSPVKLRLYRLHVEIQKNVANLHNSFEEQGMEWLQWNF